jgi:hypothetical protein
MTERQQVTLELAHVVDLADSGNTGTEIAASVLGDVGAVQELLKTTPHEPDARHLIEARANGRTWSPADDEPTEGREMGKRGKKPTLDAEQRRKRLVSAI